MEIEEVWMQWMDGLKSTRGEANAQKSGECTKVSVMEI